MQTIAVVRKCLMISIAGSAATLLRAVACVVCTLTLIVKSSVII
ncbi:MAG: hypothetical protein ACKERG_01355 [Candidatus Hodgkinia cicadicola]